MTYSIKLVEEPPKPKVWRVFRGNTFLEDFPSYEAAENYKEQLMAQDKEHTRRPSGPSFGM